MVLLLVVSVQLVPAFGQSVATFTNGGFEDGVPIPTNDIELPAGSTAITGWTVTGHSIDYMGPPWDVSEGQRAVDLDGRDAVFSGIEQTFATVAGRQYLVSFDLSGNPQGPPTIKLARVTVDGVSNDYSLDTTGQSITALLWTPVSFSFVASGSTATLSFMSLSSTPNSYGPLVDNVKVVESVPAPPRAYAFKSGVGPSLIEYCLSANGTIVRLEGPAGQEHIAGGQVWDGYTVCSGTVPEAWDLSSEEGDFGAREVVDGPGRTHVTLRRSSARVRLDQRFELDPATGASRSSRG
jgi:choice-of-anchor C domain-containing protein